MTKVISICNQKGGVGKTTTAMNLGCALQATGNEVLLIDLDAQANLSSYLGFEDNDDTPTINNLMMTIASGKQIDLDEFQLNIRHSNVNDIDYIPSDINLASADFYLAGTMLRETVLKRILTPENTASYDYVIIDCLPSLGVLLMNALSASDSVIIPVQTQKFAVDGLKMLTGIINQIKETINPKLKLMGVLATMTDNTNMTKTVLDRLNENFGDSMFATQIKKSVEAANSSEAQQSLIVNKTKLGEQYKQLAKEIISRI